MIRCSSSPSSLYCHPSFLSPQCRSFLSAILFSVFWMIKVLSSFLLFLLFLLSSSTPFCRFAACCQATRPSLRWEEESAESEPAAHKDRKWTDHSRHFAPINRDILTCGQKYVDSWTVFFSSSDGNVLPITSLQRSGCLWRPHTSGHIVYLVC